MDNHTPERTIEKRVAFEGRVFTAEVHTIEQPDGTHGTREIVVHNGGVAILAIHEGNVYLVRQYRKAAGQYLLELPAGKLEPGEDPEHCAYRELREETGLIASHMTRIGTYYVSPGYDTEVIHIYQAHDCTVGDTDPDEYEFVDVVPTPFEVAQQMCCNGEIIDAKTVIGLMVV